MNFDKAIDRDAHERGRPLTEEEIASRQRELERLRSALNYDEIDHHDLFAAYMDAIDKNREELRRLHEVVAVEQNGSGYKFKVPDEIARQVLVEVLNSRRTDPPNE